MDIAIYVIFQFFSNIKISCDSNEYKKNIINNRSPSIKFT
ncbi:MAG: hypothetical protein Edafosvirus2_34 [Edafosvirus sp.]|uniref:Uncharacterized protein n=1 Tax=Edafosvirus sp. TaxID=2487765 RepID=A0A3G4ZSI8_9VIRU|nr:MAG: hypothetical protein Edafosvirus2_34 [Edafosvirus sp.]